MAAQSNPRLVAFLQSVSRTASVVVILVGCVVVLGWVLDIAMLRAGSRATAAGFVLAGISLWVSRGAPQDHFPRRWVRRTAYAAAALVALIAAITLTGYAVGRYLGIDQLLRVDKPGGGWIAPTTGLNFLLIGCALLLLDVETRRGRRPAQVFALATAIIDLWVLTGYIYGGASSPTALMSALVFTVLSVGVLCADPDRGLMEILTSESAAGVVARRLVPAVVGGLLLAGIVTVAGQSRGIYDVPVGFSVLVVSSLVIIIPLLWWSVRSLSRIDIARHQAEEALQEANSQLTSWVGELEQRNSEINHLSEVGNLLQNCATPEEAYTVITRSAQQLFPTRSGALYVLTPTGTLLDTVAVWGEAAPVGVFAPNECWALRRGRPHAVDDSRAGLVCPHLGDIPPISYVCIPMMAQGDALGVLHLESGPLASPEDGEGEERLVDSEQRLAVTLADEIALAMANLKLRDTLRAQSIRDPLTGVFNRRYMEESVERELRRAARKEYAVGVIMLDIDDFRRFNETYGHEAGDTLLRGLGDFLKKQIRKEDIACRYGGEEFAVIMPETSLDVARQRAERLREAFKLLTITHRGRPLGEVSLSLGVAAFPQHGSIPDAVLRTADEALHRAKAEGRDRVVTAA